MQFRPRFGSPMRIALAASKFMTQVALPLMPILCSIEPHFTVLRSVIFPSASTLYFGTINSEIPFVPFGASGNRASTMCTMLSDISCSPAEMNIFVPVSLYVPSSAGSALHLSIPKSEPQCGSVKHIVPVQLPSTSFSR